MLFQFYVYVSVLSLFSVFGIASFHGLASRFVDIWGFDEDIRLKYICCFSRIPDNENLWIFFGADSSRATSCRFRFWIDELDLISSCLN